MLPLEVTWREFLDRSDITVKKLAYNLQKITLRCKISKAKTRNTSLENPLTKNSNTVLHPLLITFLAYDNNGLSQPLIVTLQVRNCGFQKMLLDRGLLVELINRKLAIKIRPWPKIFLASYIKVSLANDLITVLSEYVKISVNIHGVEAVIWAWLVDIGIYDLLLRIS